MPPTPLGHYDQVTQEQTESPGGRVISSTGLKLQSDPIFHIWKAQNLCALRSLWMTDWLLSGSQWAPE